LKAILLLGAQKSLLFNQGEAYDILTGQKGRWKIFPAKKKKKVNCKEKVFYFCNIQNEYTSTPTLLPALTSCQHKYNSLIRRRKLIGFILGKGMSGAPYSCLFG